MSSISAISLSGMQAAQAVLGLSAHNIANLATDGFRRQQVTQSATQGGGVSTSLSQVDEVGNSLEADVVSQLVARNSFLANLVVFKASDRMMSALLDATA